MRTPSAWLGALLAMSLGCTELDDRARFESAVGSLEILVTNPPQGETEVDPLARIDFCLSAEVDPRAIENFDALLHSGGLTFDGQQEVQLFSWRAPGDRTALADARWCPGSVFSLTPGAPMQPGLVYRVELRPAPLGWAGESLDTEQAGWAPEPSEDGDLRWYLEFQIAGTTADPTPEEIPELEPGPTLTELFEPGEIFDPERASCGCHQGSNEIASARLDLSTPQRAWESLVLRQGVESTDFPMITPRRPARSYLIQKLMRTESGQALHAVRGDPMPPDDSLEHVDLVRLTHWIQSGAEL